MTGSTSILPHRPSSIPLWRGWLKRAWRDGNLPIGRNFLVDALLVSLVWALANWPFLSGRSFIPWDSPDEFFPQARFVASAIRSGEAPWWNPFLHGGQPVMGDPQGMIFTPHVLVGLLAGAHFDLYLFDITSLFVVLGGSIALARYARTYADTRTLPILGALVFIAGGVATSRLQHVPQICSYGLLPMQLLALRSVCLRPTILRTLLLILVFSAAVLNPNQVVFLFAIAVMPFAGFHLCQSQYRAKAVLALAIAGTCVLAATSPVLSAIHEFMSLSNRPVLDIAESVGASFPPFDLASIFLPGLYGVLSPENGTWAPTDISQDFLYIGVIPAGVCLTSLLCVRHMSTVTILCWASVVLWFVFSMGTNAPLYPLLYHHVPLFSAFRRPADGAYLINLFFALLAGTSCKVKRSCVGSLPTLAIVIILLSVGVATICGLLIRYAQHVHHIPDLRIVVFGFIWRLLLAAPICLAVIHSKKRRISWLAAPLVIGLSIGDLCLAGRAGSVFGSKTEGSELARIYSGTLSWDKPGTKLEQSITFLQQQAVSGGQYSAFRMEALGGSLATSMPMAFQIQTTQGYDPLTFRSYDQAVGAQDLQVEPKLFTKESPDYHSSYYRRLALRYVMIQHYIATHSADFGALGTAIAQIHDVFTTNDWARKLPDAGDYEVWELPDAKPRAMLVDAEGKEQPCDLLSYGTVFLSVDCRAVAGGRLVLGEVFAPGWLACVNGEPATIEPYDGIFRSVTVSAGHSIVDFHYYPVPFLRNGSCPLS